MQIDYSFMGNTEPTDEQLHLLMQEVAADVKTRAQKTTEDFFKELSLLVKQVLEEQSKKTDKDYFREA